RAEEAARPRRASLLGSRPQHRVHVAEDVDLRGPRLRRKRLPPAEEDLIRAELREPREAVVSLADVEVVDLERERRQRLREPGEDGALVPLDVDLAERGNAVDLDQRVE